MAGYTFREQDNGSTAQVRAGATIELLLKESPTTGYKWIRPFFDESILTLSKEEFAPGGEPGAMGAGGTRHFVFIAKTEGETAIRLEKKRPWENNEDAAASFQLKVRIVR